MNTKGKITSIPQGAFREMIELAKENGYDTTKHWKNQALRDMAANSKTLRTSHTFPSEINNIFGRFNRTPEMEHKNERKKHQW